MTNPLSQTLRSVSCTFSFEWALASHTFTPHLWITNNCVIKFNWCISLVPHSFRAGQQPSQVQSALQKAKQCIAQVEIKVLPETLIASIHLWNQSVEDFMSSSSLGCDFITLLITRKQQVWFQKYFTCELSAAWTIFQRNFTVGGTCTLHKLRF